MGSEMCIRDSPWGWWHPIAEKAIEKYPFIEKNRNSKRDMFNVTIGIIWQSCLTVIPMFLVIRNYRGLSVSLVLLVISSLILYKSWYKPLCEEEKRHKEEMAKIDEVKR